VLLSLFFGAGAPRLNTSRMAGTRVPTPKRMTGRHRRRARKHLRRVAKTEGYFNAPLAGRALGKTGAMVSALGLGCFGLTNAYGQADTAESIRTIHCAIGLGCNLLDTADEYGAGENELLLGRALSGRRHQAFVQTKFGFVWDRNGKATGLNAEPEYVRRACDASLRRLRTDVIDLYYLHRVDPRVPIADTVGAMARLVQDGKVRYLGLSEVTPELIRRAAAVHPITALQSEYSLWTRDPEQAVLPLCRELGIAFVAFSPLGRGFFSAKLSPENIGSNDFRRQLPRFQPENFQINSQRLSNLRKIAEEKQCTPAQLALAWVLASAENVFAIPGSRTAAHLEENVGALTVQLSASDKRAVDQAFQPGTFVGERYAVDSPFRPE